MVSFAHGVSGRNDDPLATFHVAAKVGLDFNHPHLVILIYGVYLAVIIKQDGQVINVSAHVDVLPRPGRILGDEHLHAVAVDVGEDIKLPVVVTDTGSPNALTVGFLAVFEPELIAHVETVETIAQEFPVHQVLGMQDDHTGCAVHRRPGQIEVLTHPNQVGVGKFVIKQRIGKRAVAVVRRPRAGGLCRRL